VNRSGPALASRVRGEPPALPGVPGKEVQRQPPDVLMVGTAGAVLALV